MNIINVVGDFLLSTWLWSMTFGWSYFFIAIFLMTFFAKKIVPTSWLYAFVLSVATYLFSFALFFGSVFGLFSYFLEYWYIPHPYECAEVNPLVPMCALGLMHTIFSGLFFALLSWWRKVSAWRGFWIVVLSNGLAVLLSYWYVLIVVQDIG
jgi:hypothetical protein